MNALQRNTAIRRHTAQQTQSRVAARAAKKKNTSLKLGEAIDDFLQQYVRQEGTRRNYAKALLRFQAAMGEDRYLDDLTPRHLTRYQNDLLSDNLRAGRNHRHRKDGKLSDQTVRQYIKTLKTFFRWLVKLKEISANDNPADVLIAPPARAKIDTQALPTPKHVLLISRDLYRNREHYAMFRFLTDTGARAGEVASLRISRINFDLLEATVNGKTGLYRVWFSSGTAYALRQWLLERDHYPHEFVFATKSGHWNPNNVSLVIRRACERLGITHYSAHDFRKLKGTLMNTEGITALTAGLVLNHSSEINQRYYVRKDLRLAEEASRRTHILDPEDTDVPLRLRKAE